MINENQKARLTLFTHFDSGRMTDKRLADKIASYGRAWTPNKPKEATLSITLNSEKKPNSHYQLTINKEMFIALVEHAKENGWTK